MGVMPTFNEPETFLIDRWKDSRLLEDAMSVIRNKYKGILDQVNKQVSKSHLGLDTSKMMIGSGYGTIAFGKERWPKGPRGWHSGFFLENLHFESLVEPDRHPLYKSVWIFSDQLDLRNAQDRLRESAERILSKEDFGKLIFEPHDDKQVGFWCLLEQSRENLLKLLCENEASGFISCLVNHFEWMAQFTADLDEILGTGGSG